MAYALLFVRLFILVVASGASQRSEFRVQLFGSAYLAVSTFSKHYFAILICLIAYMFHITLGVVEGRTEGPITASRPIRRRRIGGQWWLRPVKSITYVNCLNPSPDSG
jgi:hypothetical protein